MAAVAAIAGVGMMVCCSSSVASFMMMGDDDDDKKKKTPLGPTGPTGPDPEVFWVGGPTNNYHYTKDQAAATCTTHGAVVSTNAQLTAAHAAGADWCATGWLSDADSARYPITTTTLSGCGNGEGSDPAIMSYVPPDGKAGVNCYGIKPVKDATSEASIRGFTPEKWSRHD
jgi:hypothetical protein